MLARFPRMKRAAAAWLAASSLLCAAGIAFFAVENLRGQTQPAVRSDQEKAIVEELGGLRKVTDDERARATKRLALEIRQLPSTVHKVALATGLANLSTEGDFGGDTLQEVATTLAEALRERPVTSRDPQQPAAPYVELAELVRYESVQVSLDAPQFAAAMAELSENERARQAAKFTLKDLHGKSWTLKSLPDKVVLVNFWATWCQPCRKEMPDLEKLYQRFRKQGLVILAITDEDAAKAEPFAAEFHVSYPILLDPGGNMNTVFRIGGIPKSLVYDRQGKLVAQAIDMWTEAQFLHMLAKAGLR